MIPMLLLFSLAAASASPVITFLCDEMPDICANMCWAIRCAHPRMPQVLTLISPATQGRFWRGRNLTATCATNSMCGAHGVGRVGHRATDASCNVYPFGGSDGGGGDDKRKGGSKHAVSRCVPETQQRRQNGQLSLLSASTTGPVRVNLGNPRGVAYCDNGPCRNDGFEVQHGRIGHGRDEKDEVVFEYYRAASGMVLASVEGWEGTRFSRCVGREEVVGPGVRTWHEGGMRMMDDAVVEKL